jgi:hypothetical protein
MPIMLNLSLVVGAVFETKQVPVFLSYITWYEAAKAGAAKAPSSSAARRYLVAEGIVCMINLQHQALFA